jgi:hypothetical protein
VRRGRCTPVLAAAIWSGVQSDHLRDGFRVTESASLAGKVSFSSSSSCWSTRCQSALSSADLVAGVLFRAVVLLGVCDRLAEIFICQFPCWFSMAVSMESIGGAHGRPPLYSSIGKHRLKTSLATAPARTSKLMFKKLNAISDDARGCVSNNR